MKIVAVLSSDISCGGGYNQALNALLQMARIIDGKHEFAIITTNKKNTDILKGFGLHTDFFRRGFWAKASNKLPASNLWQRLQRRFNIRTVLEKELLQRGCDIVYFVEPNNYYRSLQELNYISTVWDLCHLDMMEFPEVRNFNEVHNRESLYRNCLPPSFLIIADSEALMQKIATHYNIDPERIISMPFTESPFLKEKSSDTEAVLNLYTLTKGFFFYPAQFWAHKNHVRILEAMALLREQGIKRQIVFAGGDAGNLDNVKRCMKRLGLEEHVRFLGFVPAEHVRPLYEGCAAVIMPTYFGPTNLPPLEAWSVGKPLIYSKHLAEQAGEAALLVDPDDATSLAEAMKSVLNPETAIDLVKRGHERLMHFDAVRRASEHTLEKKLNQMAVRLRTWKYS